MTKGKKEHEGLSRVHIHVYSRDWEDLDRIFGGPDQIGKAKAARALIRAGLNQIRAKAEQHAKAVPVSIAEVNKLVEAEL